jgi:DNA recombination protein RmuC
MGIMPFGQSPIVYLIAVLLTLAVLLAVALRRRGKPGTADPRNAHEELLRRISRQLDALDGIGKRVDGLDRAFRIPRMRGGFGESLLEELLGAWLPEGSWTTQYAFPDGTRADAVVRMGKRLVAVDSKFPLERIEGWLMDDDAPIDGEVKRAIRGHAESIASKYIRPEDGTLSFALMYLPAENLHYRLLRDDDGSIMRACLTAGVLPVGPMSLFAYLQTVSYGLKGLSLPEEGRELRRRIDRLRRDFEALAKPLATASTHLKNLNRSWEEIDRRFGRLEDGLDALDSSPEKRDG